MEDAEQVRAQQVFAAKKIFIPSRLIRELQELDPMLDSGWERKVHRVFSKLARPERRYAYTQYLEPKGISVDPLNQRLMFSGRESLKDALIRVATPDLKALGERQLATLERMRAERNPEAFAEMAEQMVDAIQAYDVEENLSIQREKNWVSAGLLSDLVGVTREARFADDTGRRKLNAESIKDYLIEVYVKHATLGYRFRSLPVDSLQEFSQSFIRGAVFKEARDRQCDVIRTERYLYLVAPEGSGFYNPFSIRRFLKEEVMMQGERIYFNGIAIALDQRLDDPDYQHHCVHCASRMITLQRQLSENIVELVKRIERIHKRKLSPMLAIDPEHEDGDMAVAYSVRYQVQEVEDLLKTQILRGVRRGLDEYASTDDDYEFLFISLRHLLIEIAGEVRDFAAQAPGSRQEADNLELRILSFLHLMDKRRREVFTRARGSTEVANEQISQMVRELLDVLKQGHVSVTKLKALLKLEVERLQKMGRLARAVRDKWLTMRDQPLDTEGLRQQIVRARYRCFIEMVRILKQHKKLRVYLELEGIVDIVEGVRHYALAQGHNGFSVLPVLLVMQESGETFNISETRIALTRVP